MKNTKEVTHEFTPEKSPVPIDENNPGQRAISSVTRGWVTNQKLNQLKDAYKDITAVTKQGYKECVKAISVVRGLRTRLEKSRLEKNKGDHEKIALRNKEAKRITAILLEIEAPLKEMKHVEDERVAKEKAEKERAEKERVDAIKQRMEDNFGQHQIDDLADKRSTYTQARIRIIEAYQVDDSYEEFQEKAAFLRGDLLKRVRHIYVAQHDQEQADKHLQDEKAKLDAEKQEMAAQAKLLEEREKAFEEERAEWRAKQAAEEKAPEEAEAEAGQAVDEEPAPGRAHERAGGVEAQEEAPGDRVTDSEARGDSDPVVESCAEAGEHMVNGPQFYDETEDEETAYPEDELSSESEEALASYGHRTNREKLVELIQVETGVVEFNDEDLTDLLSLAEGMYWADQFYAPIRHLAGLVRKELELHDHIPE